MAEKEMVEEVRGLISDGFELEKIKANLVKIGYSEADADRMVAEAQKSLAPPEPPQAKVEAAVAGDEELLLAAGEDAGEPVPATLPPVKNPPAPPKKPPAPPGKPQGQPKRSHRHQRESPAPPEPMEEETPKSGAGKAMVIFFLALIVIAAMAYFILLPKLGI